MKPRRSLAVIFKAFFRTVCEWMKSQVYYWFATLVLFIILSAPPYFNRIYLYFFFAFIHMGISWSISYFSWCGIGINNAVGESCGLQEAWAFESGFEFRISLFKSQTLGKLLNLSLLICKVEIVHSTAVFFQTVSRIH